jgi:uncharacterized protein (DUF2252 family)
MWALKERLRLGKELRSKIGRNRQSDWSPKTGRKDPVATIVAANSNRLQFLLPIKMGRMAAGPFAFFRGGAPLMAADLATLPVTGLQVQICGDAHVHNLGAYAAPEGHLVFDINDFDETIAGPWEWDLKRLATSLVLAGREAGESNSACRDSVEAMVRSYRTSMNRFAAMTLCELAKVEIRRGEKGTLVHAVLQKASRVTPIETLKKLAVAGPRAGHRFHDMPPVLRHVDAKTRSQVVASLPQYLNTISPSHQWILNAYEPVDVAFKIVGTGSVGTRDYLVLLFGRGVQDPLILQVKEELPSCYAAYLRRVPPAKHEGRRVAEGQQKMQTVADPFLGYTTIDGRHFLVRQLSDHKASIDLANLQGTALLEYAAVCGELLAKGHARTGKCGVIAGYCGNSNKLDTAVAKFARAYADQTESDFEQFKKAIASRRVRSVLGKSD